MGSRNMFAKSFDPNAYWIDRHIRFSGDPRSVGNAGKTVAENLAGEALLRAELALAVAAAGPAEAVLDIGCGYGRLADVFIDAGLSYLGIDVSDRAVAAARLREPRGTYLVGPAQHLDWGPPCDLVAVIYVFVHFVDDDAWDGLIARIAAFLPPGGRLLFADHLPDARRSPAPHVVERPLEDYRRSFAQHGLVLDETFRDRMRSLATEPSAVSRFLLARKG